MSGVFGYVDPIRKMIGTSKLCQMGAVMTHRPWYETIYVYDDLEGVGLGRIGIGVFNKSKEAVWNRERTKALLFTGEIYNLSSFNKHASKPENTLLELYEEEGQHFLKRLNGSFLFVLWDKMKNLIFIANDRFGTYPLFYSLHAGRLIFAPEIKGVLIDREIPRDLDLVGTAQYMRFQQFLGTRTYFESIKYLPGASVLTFQIDSGSLEVRKYWTYDTIPHNPNISFQESVEETGRMLREVVVRLSGDEYRPGVFLSGGFDSRTIIGLIERRPIVSFTFGHKDCRDVRYAEMIARTVGSEHHWYDFPDGKWVEENVNFHWALTEGMHNWVHLHSITMLPDARQQFDVNLCGMGGGPLLKSPKVWKPQKFNGEDDYELVRDMFMVMTVKHTWPGLTEAEERLLYTRIFLEKIQGLAFDSLVEELNPYESIRPELRGEFFLVDNSYMRLLNNMAVFGRSHVEFRYPYLDNELFDFVFSLPIHYRTNMRFARSLLTNELPNLSKIPYDADEFLLTDRSLSRNFHALQVKTKRRFNRIFFPLFPEWQTLYADYEEYLRKDLRSWAEGFLFDGRTVKRGIFAPDAVRSLMSRHCSGKELWTIGKIAPLISFEMSLRNLIDTEV